MALWEALGYCISPPFGDLAGVVLGKAITFGRRLDRPVLCSGEVCRVCTAYAATPPLISYALVWPSSMVNDDELLVCLFRGSPITTGFIDDFRIFLSKPVLQCDGTHIVPLYPDSLFHL